MEIENISFSTNLFWVESLAKQYNGKIEGNFIVPHKKIADGRIFFLDCGNGISIMHLNLSYNCDYNLDYRKKEGDYIAFYYTLDETPIQMLSNQISRPFGKWHYNLVTIDSSLNHQYTLKAESKVETFCLVVKKETIKAYINKEHTIKKNVPRMLDPKKNTFIEFNRMTNESMQLLSDLEKVELGNQIHDLQLIATANLLFSDYMSKIATEKNVIQKVNDTDLSIIIEIQKKLIVNVEEHFPGIETLANEANMSGTKFKLLFKKITRTSPNIFFLNCKLEKAKELLNNKQHSVSQISDQLKFTTNSYFIAKFKEKYGMTPKTYTQQLL